MPTGGREWLSGVPLSFRGATPAFEYVTPLRRFLVVRKRSYEFGYIIPLGVSRKLGVIHLWGVGYE